MLRLNPWELAQAWYRESLLEQQLDRWCAVALVHVGWPVIVATHKSRNKTIKKKRTVEKPSRHLRPWNPRSLTQSCALHPNTWTVVFVRATHRCSAGFRRQHFFQRAPVLTWTKHILMGVSLFEHEDAVNHGLALGRHLPCPCTAPITSSYQLYCNSSRHSVYASLQDVHSSARNRATGQTTVA